MAQLIRLLPISYTSIIFQTFLGQPDLNHDFKAAKTLEISEKRIKLGQNTQ